MLYAAELVFQSVSQSRGRVGICWYRQRKGVVSLSKRLTGLNNLRIDATTRGSGFVRRSRLWTRQKIIGVILRTLPVIDPQRPGTDPDIYTSYVDVWNPAQNGWYPSRLLG